MFVMCLHRVRAQKYVVGLCAGARLWIFSGILQLITAARVCFMALPPPFQTEGKQMRRNVNSRLLMQRCAKKNMRPRSLGCVRGSTGRPPVRPSGQADSFWVTNPRVSSFRFSTAEPLVHTHSGAHVSAALLSKQKSGPPPTLYQPQHGM